MATQQNQRRTELDARFKAQDAARKAEKERRKEANDASADPTENAEAFCKKFNEDVSGVTKDMRQTVKRAGDMGDAQKRVEMPPHVDDWVTRMAALEASLSSASIFLPAYDMRQCQGALGRLREALDDARAAIVPRKKFTFKSRHKMKHAGVGAGAGAGAGAGSAGAGAGDAAAADDTCAKFEVAEKCFENKKGETLIVRPGQLSGSNSSGGGGDDDVGSDFRLSNLENCTVIICDVVRALHIDRLTNCTVIGGVCAGSVLLEGSSDSTFFLATRQARLHHATKCVFYLHIISRPIIEDCSGLKFAAYNLQYQDLQKQLATANLNKPAALQMWQKVDDFRWHRKTQSPNWALLDDASRMKALPIPLAVAGEFRLSLKATASAAPATAAVTTTAAAAAASNTGDAAADASDDDDDDDEL